MKNLYLKLINYLNSYLDSFTLFMGNLIYPIVKHISYHYNKSNSIVLKNTRRIYHDININNINREWLLESICTVNNEVYNLLKENNGFLGEGSYGMAFRVADNKVVKITTDLNEIRMAKHLIKNNYKFFIKVYKIFKVYYNKNLIGAVIIKDYVEDVNYSQNCVFWKSIKNYCKNYYKKEDTHNSKTWFVDINYNITELWEYLKKKNIHDKYYSILMDKELMCKEFNKFNKKFKLKTLDIHPDNFGFNNGHFILFDVSGFNN